MQPDLILPFNPDLSGMAFMARELAYTCEGQSQPLTLALPGRDWQKGDGEKIPLLIYLQGSGFTSPNRLYLMPQLCAYAQRGLAVAAITHRDSTQGHPFPAYLKDTKAAIRFLRSIAAEYHLNENRFGALGTSSGGNAMLLCGLTGDDPRYATADYSGYSDALQAVVDCFGPTDMLDYEGGPLRGDVTTRDILALKQRALETDDELMAILFALFGENDPIAVLKAMSPVYEVRDGQAYPPFLIAQGDSDTVVPLSQSVKMHEKLKLAGADSSLLVVAGAGHEGSFWSAAVHEAIFSFLSARLLP